MIGVVQRKGQAFASTKVLRKPIVTEEDVQKGSELRAKIYSGVGNSEIFGLMDKYFTDLCKLLLQTFSLPSGQDRLTIIQLHAQRS